MEGEDKTTLQQLGRFDKKPLTYQSIVKKPSRGRFGTRKSEGHTGIVEMKRTFLSGVSPAFQPSKSRMVEAICIHLCNMIPCHKTTTTNGRRRFDSRWKLIVKAYNNIRARLFNSTLLQETNITLFCVNEHTVKLWGKTRPGEEQWQRY